MPSGCLCLALHPGAAASGDICRSCFLLSPSCPPAPGCLLGGLDSDERLQGQTGSPSSTLSPRAPRPSMRLARWPVCSRGQSPPASCPLAGQASCGSSRFFVLTDGSRLPCAGTPIVRDLDLASGALPQACAENHCPGHNWPRGLDCCAGSGHGQGLAPPALTLSSVLLRPAPSSPASGPRVPAGGLRAASSSGGQRQSRPPSPGQRWLPGDGGSSVLGEVYSVAPTFICTCCVVVVTKTSLEGFHKLKNLSKNTDLDIQCAWVTPQF